MRLKLGPYPDAADIERYENAERERLENERKRRDAIREKRKKESEKFWESEAEANAYSEQIAEAFERIFESGENSESKKYLRDSARESEKNAVEKKKDDLRELYRSIVRRLHPDTGHEMTGVEKDWWNQAQQAYRNSDIEILKLLALRIQGQGEIEIDKIDHIGTLIELCAALFEQQEQIERQKKHLKRDPIYRFWMSRSKTSSRDKLSFEIRAGLQSQLRRLKEFVSEVKSRLHELERFASLDDDSTNGSDAEFDPRQRRRARVNPSGRGRGRSRGR